MKQPLWSRRRRGGDGARPDGSRDGVPIDDGHETLAERLGEAPQRDRPLDPGEVRARLRASTSTAPAPSGVGSPSEGTPGDDRRAAYEAWADRLRSHKKDKLAGIVIETGTDRPAEPGASSPYWDPANLFQGVDEQGPADPTLMGNRDLFALLGLADNAGSDEIQGAYRRLAKEHHPDRWVDADPEVRAGHAEQMALIAEAHRELRRRLATR